MSVAICLQFYSGDWQKAERLARFIATIEPAKRDDVIFCFVRKYGTPGIGEAAIDAIRGKFIGDTFTTNTKAEGWPAGCNAVVCDLFTESLVRLRTGQWKDVEALILLEPDCVPLTRNWLDLLIAEWARAKAAGAWVMGTWRPSGGQHGHINGVCMIRSDIAALCPCNYAHGMIAWDCFFMPLWKGRTFVSDLFLNHFGSKEAKLESLYPPSVWNEMQPAIVHGYKDDSALEIARKKIL